MTVEQVERAYREHADALVHYATVLVGADDALDVLNDVVLATLRGNRLDGVADPLAYWTRAITWTAAGWHRRRLRRQHREQRAAGQRTPANAEPGAVAARAQLACLSPQQRAVVYLTYWRDLDVGQVAATLGVSDGTIRKQLARARARLREVIDHEFID